MVSEVKYGVISDVHGNPRIVVGAMSVLKGLGADRLVLNGDIGGFRGNAELTMGALSFILEQAGQLGLETFVQPGSHEAMRFYQPVVDMLCGNKSKYGGKYPNLFDVTKQLKFEMEGHHLVFVPGSDSFAGGEYLLGTQFPSARYVQMSYDDNGKPSGLLLPLCKAKKYCELINKGVEYDGVFQYFNVNDISRLVTEPKKTIVVCHVPRKFNLPNGVDRAEFGLVENEFLLNKEPVRRGSIFKIEDARVLKEKGAPIEIKNENIGNEDLASLYHQIGITKAVSGHIHEASHRAHDVKCNNVPEGTFVNELYWNSGCMDKGHCGLLSVRGEEVAYKNVDLNVLK